MTAGVADALVWILLGGSLAELLISLVGLMVTGSSLADWGRRWLTPWWRTEIQGRCPQCSRSLRRVGGYWCWICRDYRRELR